MDKPSPRQHRDRLASELDALWRAAGDPSYASLAKRVTIAREGPTPGRLPTTVGDWRRGLQAPRDAALFRDVVEALNDLTAVRARREGIGALGGYQVMAWPSWLKLLKQAQAEPLTASEPRSAGPFPAVPVNTPEVPELRDHTVGRPPGGGRPGRRRVLLLGGAVVVLAGAVLVLPQVFPDEASTSGADTGELPDAGAVRIDSPRDRDAVASPVLVQGTAVVPEGQVLWILVQAPDGAYYPAVRHPVDVDGEGAWSISVSLGRDAGDVGLSYVVHAVVAPVSGSGFEAAVVDAEKSGGSVRFADMPPDATRLSDVHVTLGGRGPAT